MRWWLLVVGLGLIVAWGLWPRETVLHTSRSKFQTLVVVEDDKRRCLRFGEGDAALNQSCRSRREPRRVELDYARALTAITLSLEPAPQRVLLIGLGGASIPNALLAERPDLHLDAVEIDPEVIVLAERYFDFKPSPTVRAFGEDAVDFVRRAATEGQQYDLVILDACDEKGMPPPLYTAEFLAQLRQLLGERGVLLSNGFAKAASSPAEALAVRKAFGAVTEIGVVRNRLLMAGPGRLPTEVTPALSRIGVETDWLTVWRR